MTRHGALKRVTGYIHNFKPILSFSPQRSLPAVAAPPASLPVSLLRPGAYGDREGVTSDCGSGPLARVLWHAWEI
jgi:hypothetical protein